MNFSGREFIKSTGVLIVTFSAESFTGGFACAQGPFDTHASHIDPKQLDSWIAVAADGTVTAFTGKCDFGQGMFTVQTQLVAEELCVPIASVKLIQCDTAVAPDQGTTSGSQSTPRRRLRHAKHLFKWLQPNSGSHRMFSKWPME